MIYFAGPLFTAAERQFNRDLSARLADSLGKRIFLPQDECAGLTNPADIFRRCREGVRSCDMVLAIVDGIDADSGTAWEMGYATGLGRPVVALRTDFRQTGEDGGMNLMLSRGCDALVTVSCLEHGDMGELIDALLPVLKRFIGTGGHS